MRALSDFVKQGCAVGVVLFEPLVLLDGINLDFLFSAAVFADASFLDISEPFHTVAIRICTDGFEDD
jgi:hypothetical protein